jgi:hypothetical protein
MRSISSTAIHRYSLRFRGLDVVLHEKCAALPYLPAAMTGWILLFDAFDLHTPARVLAINHGLITILTHAPDISMHL